MNNYEKQKMLSELSMKIADELKRHDYCTNYIIMHMLLETFDKYVLVDEQKLRDKLEMIPKDDCFTEAIYDCERYDMSLTVTANVAKEELKNHRKELEEYLSDYMKDEFCYTLDKNEKTTEFEDYVKFRKILEENGLTDYESVKNHFDRIRFERDLHRDEELDRYYRGGR